MSVNLDNSNPPVEVARPAQRRFRIVAAVLGEPLWVIFSMFGLASVTVVTIMKLSPWLDLASETTVGQLVLNVLVYALAVFFVLLPLLIRKTPRDKLLQLLGLDRALSGVGVAWALSAFALYFWATILVGLLAAMVPGFDSNQPQDVGFSGVNTGVGYVLAFIGLVVLPPIFEELLFRGYLFGKIRSHVNFWVATLVTSVAFGFVHGQWNVGLDTFVLSLFLCFLRERTGSLWAPMILHGTKNGLAYFFIFIAPLWGINLL